MEKRKLRNKKERNGKEKLDKMRRKAQALTRNENYVITERDDINTATRKKDGGKDEDFIAWKNQIEWCYILNETYARK